MGWKLKVLIVFKRHRNNDLGGAERKLLDTNLGNWVYCARAEEKSANLVGHRDAVIRSLYRITGLVITVLFDT